MNLVVPEMGNCVRAVLDMEFPCTAAKFREFKRGTGMDPGARFISLLDWLPKKEALVTVDLPLRRQRTSRLDVGIEVRRVRKPPERPAVADRAEIDSSVFWDRLAALVPEQPRIDTQASFHYAAGTYQLRDVDLQGSALNVPKAKPAVLVDGVSLRFANFPRGLQRMRVYTVGPLRGEKCLQVDVYHRFESTLSEDVLETTVSLSRVAAGMLVEEKRPTK